MSRRFLLLFFKKEGLSFSPPHRRIWRMTGSIDRLLLLGFLLAVQTGWAEPAPQPATADITLTESGSTLLQPLFDIWVAAYGEHHPGVHITTSGIGSEA